MQNRKKKQVESNQHEASDTIIFSVLDEINQPMTTSAHVTKVIVIYLACLLFVYMVISIISTANFVVIYITCTVIATNIVKQGMHKCLYCRWIMRC